jgi:hypothetical protein
MQIKEILATAKELQFSLKYQLNKTENAMFQPSRKPDEFLLRAVFARPEAKPNFKDK